MVPPPLKSQPFSVGRYPLSIRDAISTAASPLQNSFQLSCRSPLPPGTQAYDRERSPDAPGSNSDSVLAQPGSHHPSTRNSACLGGLQRAGATSEANNAVCYTRCQDGGREWPVLPTTPSTLRYKHDNDEGRLGIASTISIVLGKTVGVGAYTIPAAIFDNVGSVGMSLLVWVIGSIISFCGLAVYLEFGTAMPKSGGERVYLERIFRRPRMLATCMFMSYTVLLGFSTPNAIVLGDYVLYALDLPRDRWSVRIIAVLAVSAICYTHARFPRAGLKAINALSVSKLLVLAFFVVCGVIGGVSSVGCRAGLNARRPDLPLSHDWRTSTSHRNFHNIWEGSSTQPYDYATALLKVIYCFRGYSTANQVVSEVKNPVKTLKVAVPVALGIVSVAYLAVNIALFLVVEKEDFRSGGIVIAGIFFQNLFGDAVGGHILPFFVVISAAGNIAATSFAQARVNETLAADGLLPMSKFWTTRVDSRLKPLDRLSKSYPASPSAPHTPSRGLLLHWAVSVVMILVPPPGQVYNFLIDIGSYPVSVISVAISLGLLYLRCAPSQEWSSPFPASLVAIVVFAASNCLLLIFPWIPPSSGQGADGGVAYYAYPATALAILASGALYWCWWGLKSQERRSKVDGEEWSERHNEAESSHLLLARPRT